MASPSLFEGEYSFVNDYIPEKENTFKCIFIPNNNNIEPFEINLSNDSNISLSQIKNLLKCEELIKKGITTKDESFFYFPRFDFKKDENSENYVKINERACKIKKKKQFGGDSILIRSDINRNEKSLTYKEFQLVEKQFVPKLKVFDFENHFYSTAVTDLISLILSPSNFNLNSSLNWNNSVNSNLNSNNYKNSTTLLNEYKSIISHLEFSTITKEINKSYYSICTIIDITISSGGGGDIIQIFSNLQKNQDDSIKNLNYRVLNYLITNQQIQLGHIKENEINKDNFTFQKDHLEELSILKQQQQLEQQTNEDKVELEETIVNSNKKVKQQPENLIEKVKKYCKNEENTIELFGVKINNEHKYVNVREGISNHIIYQSSSNKWAKLGDEVSISFQYYLPNGKILKEQTTINDLLVGSNDQIIDGLHYSLLYMCEGDLVFSIISSEYAYGEKGIVNGDVPPFTPIGCLIELKEISIRNKPTPVQLSTMSIQDKIKSIEKNNEIAKKNFIINDYYKALKFYRISESYCTLDHIGKISNNQLWDNFKLLAARTFTNISMCYRKMLSENNNNNNSNNLFSLQLKRIIEYCEQSIMFEETSKAFVLKSNAHEYLEEYEKAIEDMEIAQEIDSNISKDTTNCTLKVSQSQEKYKADINKLKRLKKKQNQQEIEQYNQIFKQLSESDLNEPELQKEDESDFEKLKNNINKL